MIPATRTSRTIPTTSLLLRGNYAEGNFGDDALLLAAERLLAQHSARIVTDREVAYRDSRLSGLVVDRSSNSRFDAIVYGGGTQFFSFSHDQSADSSPLSFRLLRKLARPASLIESYRARRKHWIENRTPRLAIGFGVGPFAENSPSEIAAASLLKRMKLVWVRDDYSMQFCDKHGVENALRSSDLCFTTAFAAAVRQPHRMERNTDNRKRVGIVLRDWKSLDDTYFAAVIEAARRLRERGVEPTFFSMAPSDRRFLSVLRRSSETVIAWRCDADGLEAFWDALGQMDLVVTARFHGAVFSTLSEVPFLTIGIEPKLETVSEWAPGRELPSMILKPISNPDFIERAVLAALSELDMRREVTYSMLNEQRFLAKIGEARLSSYLDDLTRP